MSAQVIAVVNQKGGVGKTTTSINLASFIAELGHKTLLIDCDPQANATSGVGLKTREIGATLYEALMDPSNLKDALYPTPFDRLHIIPASKNLAGAEIELVNMVSRETYLKKMIEVVKPHYDYILLDCPPSLSLLTINSLVSADHVIIPVQCEYFALEGLASLTETIERIKEGFNPGLNMLGIVLTMFDKRTSLNRQVVTNAKDFFQQQIFQTIVPRNIRLTEAPSHGLPIALYSPSSIGSNAYENLAQEVIHRVHTYQQQQ